MIFLITYDRGAGKSVSVRTYSSGDLKQAQDERLRLELDLNRQGNSEEVIILEAEDEQALRRTHFRYFSDLDEMARAATEKLGSVRQP